MNYQQELIKELSGVCKRYRTELQNQEIRQCLEYVAHTPDYYSSGYDTTDIHGTPEQIQEGIDNYFKSQYYSCSDMTNHGTSCPPGT